MKIVSDWIADDNGTVQFTRDVDDKHICIVQSLDNHTSVDSVRLSPRQIEALIEFASASGGPGRVDDLTTLEGMQNALLHDARLHYAYEYGRQVERSKREES